MKTIISAMLFALLLSSTSVSFAEYTNSANQPDDQDLIVDLFIVRPLGIVGSVGGIVMHGVGLLFSVPGENYSETAEVLVEEPLNYTFNRPLGHFEQAAN